MDSAANAAFHDRYGPWALVAGAAEGLGAGFARALAARGLSLVLVDRLEGPLDATAGRITSEHGVEVRAVALDLAREDVDEALSERTADLDVGLVVYNAALSPIGPFLEQTRDALLETIAVNCRGPLLVSHAFGRRLVERGRGGIVLLSSLSGSQGQGWLATYAATKAFSLVLAEGLWDELRRSGVDVLALRPGATRTPGYERSAPRKAPRLAPPVMEAEDVVREALDGLGSGPNLVPGRANRLVAQIFGRLMPRRSAIETMGRTARALRGDGGRPGS